MMVAICIQTLQNLRLLVRNVDFENPHKMTQAMMPIISRRHMVCHFLFALLTTFYCNELRGQVPDISDQMATPIPGVGHHYLGLNSDLLTETVNPSTGSLSVSIPIQVPRARGLNLPVSFMYNSSGVIQFGQDAPDAIGDKYFMNGNLNSGVGWAYSFPTMIAQEVDNQSMSTCVIDGCPPIVYSCPFSTGYIFQDPQGARHDMGLSVATSYEVNSDCGNTSIANPSSFLVGGDAMYFASTPDPGGSTSGVPQPVTVTGTDGTVYYFSQYNVNANTSTSNMMFAAYPSYIEDRNGNKAVLSYSPAKNSSILGAYTYTDSIGRNSLYMSTMDMNSNTSTISSASNSSNYIVQWRKVSASSFQDTNVNILSPAATNDCTAPAMGDNFSYVVSSITLPNGEAVSFEYDSVYGLLDKIIYPSGAYIKYTWGMNELSEIADFNSKLITNASEWLTQTYTCVMQYGMPAITSRDVSYDGNSIAEHQTYAYATNWNLFGGQQWSAKTTTVTTTDQVRGRTSDIVVYTYAPLLVNTPKNIPSNGAFTAVERSVAYYPSGQGVNATPLKMIVKAWDDQYRIRCEVDTMDGISSYGTWYSYGSTTYKPQTAESYTVDTVNVTDVKLYDIGKISANSCLSVSETPSSVVPLKETSVSYQSFSNNPLGGLITNAPSSVKIYGAGVLMAETDMQYDGVALSPVVARNHDDAIFPYSRVSPRGNMTQKTVRCWPSCGDVNLNYTWDNSGQLSTVQDARLNVTTLSHIDSGVNLLSGSTNAYLTQVVHPMVNGINHIEKYQYDYLKGNLASVIDPNGNITQYEFNDSMNRLTKIVGPSMSGANYTISYTYQDSGAQPTLTTSELLNASGAMKTTASVQDGMGHPIQSQETLVPQGTVYSQTLFDGYGRPYLSWNPSRCNPTSVSSCPNETSWGITGYTYDAIGRMMYKCNPDNGTGSSLCAPKSDYEKWIYSGATVTYRDENGNSWLKASDALGNIISVSEPGSLSTSYTYDVLGNLTKVNQIGHGDSDLVRKRSFTYNSLSQLLVSQNPETGAVCYGAFSGSVCLESYDGNGNLTSKTDARGVMVNYSYDALNRITSKSFSGDIFHTPIVCYQYDTATNGVGRLGAEWTQPSGTTCSSTPSVGQFLTLKSYLSYDAMGRLTSATQQHCVGTTCTATTPYMLTLGYDLAGNLTSLTNSVGAQGTPLTLSHFYDAAARPCLSTSSWLSGSFSPNIFQADPTSGYAAFGSLQNWYLGSNAATASSGCDTTPSSLIHLQHGFDNRLRITSFSATGQVP